VKLFDSNKWHGKVICNANSQYIEPQARNPIYRLKTKKKKKKKVRT
jgi:hypothetical protein